MSLLGGLLSLRSLAGSLAISYFFLFLSFSLLLSFFLPPLVFVISFFLVFLLFSCSLLRSLYERFAYLTPTTRRRPPHSCSTPLPPHTGAVTCTPCCMSGTLQHNCPCCTITCCILSCCGTPSCTLMCCTITRCSLLPHVMDRDVVFFSPGYGQT